MSDPYVTVNTITLGYVSLSDSLSISISFIYLIPLSFSAVILPPFLRHSCLLLSLCSLSSPPSPLTYLFPLSVPASVPLPFPLCLPPFPLSLSLSFSALFLTLFLNSLALFSLSLSLKRSLSLSHHLSQGVTSGESDVFAWRMFKNVLKLYVHIFQHSILHHRAVPMSTSSYT